MKGRRRRKEEKVTGSEGREEEGKVGERRE